MARYQHFIALGLALLLFLSSVGVNAYAGYCACRGQNFISFLYKNQCCKHEDTPKCCLSAGKICTKADFELEKTKIQKVDCCQTESFYSNVSAEIDKLPTFNFLSKSLFFSLPKLSFIYKNTAKKYAKPVKIKTVWNKTYFINWLPPPSLTGRKLLNFCQVYRC